MIHINVKLKIEGLNDIGTTVVFQKRPLTIIYSIQFSKIVINRDFTFNEVLERSIEISRRESIIRFDLKEKQLMVDNDIPFENDEQNQQKKNFIGSSNYCSEDTEQVSINQ